VLPLRLTRPYSALNNQTAEGDVLPIVGQTGNNLSLLGKNGPFASLSFTWPDECSDTGLSLQFNLHPVVVLQKFQTSTNPVHKRVQVLAGS
jgi:hypothetical protein